MQSIGSYNGHGKRTWSTAKDYMGSRHYRFLQGRFQTPDPVNGSISSPQSWNLYTYVQNNPMMFTDPWGFGRNKETAGVNISTVLCYDCKTEEEKKLECEMRGCSWKLGECWCGNVYYGDFAETITITATDEDPIRKAFEESVLKADIFSDWLEFLAYVSQPTMHKGQLAFRPNYNDPAVQIMSMVSQNLNHLENFGYFYMSALIGAIPVGSSILPFKFIWRTKGVGAEPIHIGLDYAKRNIIHYGVHNKWGRHIGILFNKSGYAWKHIYLEHKFPFIRIWP